MSRSGTPFKTLSRTYASHIISRDQYIKIRGELLRKLQNGEKISNDNLRSFDELAEVTDVEPPPKQGYSSSDWVIIALGLLAALVLALILYN